ncbi:adenosine trna methylthiotransferase [Nannochloropsis gaditana]|uniref:Adenosine trna methylthiotransferase n=1 Tax=Nannochloropsis gaditana TaxID=72520 RepID=W7TFZ3_9STRA|nr:adenosine trna methylthiotransferase [Nannochloropsis gaditana]
MRHQGHSGRRRALWMVRGPVLVLILLAELLAHGIPLVQCFTALQRFDSRRTPAAVASDSYEIRRQHKHNYISCSATAQKLWQTSGAKTMEESMNLSLKDFKERIEAQRRKSVIAVRARHLLVEVKPLCDSLFEDVKKGAEFHALAAAISACSVTRDAGGDVGWIGMADEFMEDVLPRHVRELALQHKPGDVFKITSLRGFHLVKIEDVMFDLSYTSKPQGRVQGRGLLPTPLKELMAKDKDDAALVYAVETMGCAMNTADSERMAGQLSALGFREAASSEEVAKADVVVVNTCSIRDHAEQKVYSYLGPYVNRKKRGDNLAIVVAGCVAQQEGQAIVSRFPEVDLVIGPQYANRLGDLLEEVMDGNQVVATEATHIMEDVSKPRRDSDIRAWVNIIYGCNERCTYCVVPTTRGTEQSRPRESVIREIEELARSGYREITLLGQNIDAWGRDLTPKQKFSDLLHAVGRVEGIKRVRFVTSHPRYMSMNVVDAVASIPNMCEMFHVPVQSGDDDILKKMSRGYTVSKFLEIVERIRSLLPDAAVTSDIIVGFPGETEAQFQNTLRLMEIVKFDQVNTAAYSPRPNTPAATYEDQISDDVKSDRLQRINKLAAEHAMERNHRYLGREVEVLVESRHVKDPRLVKGRNRQGRPVLFEGNIEELRGKLVPVLIKEVRSYMLGTIVKRIQKWALIHIFLINDFSKPPTSTPTNVKLRRLRSRVKCKLMALKSHEK